MKQFNLYNNITGWLVFLFALIVYTLTLEPTVSFWDTGEFIATADKLEIAHPPGAPLFAIVGRLFVLLAPDVASKAWMINFFSGLSSAFAILFLFWIITAIGRKLFTRNGETLDTPRIIAILGAGAIGAAAGTFLDSFWFSAVEGEVYAFSAFFTMLIFWAMFKWDYVADQYASDRWIVLIALLIGISIGVHLLALLAIPAVAFIYYYRKYTPSTKGFIVTFLVGFVLLAFVLWGVLDVFVHIGAEFDKIFVNSFGLPFSSGLLFFVLLVFILSGLGIFYARKRRMKWAVTAIMSFLMLIIGISSYAMVLIRADANPPINMNNPSDAYSLYSYLKREQYGSRPLVYGPYFTAQPIGYEVTGTRYGRAEDKYIEIGKKTDYDFDVNEADLRARGIPEGQIQQIKEMNKQVLLPRMGSLEERHQQLYRQWVDLGPNEIPTYADNLEFLFNYQLWYMYARYFLWNFSGRQDDLQGYIDKQNGNWITGIRPIDKAMIGPALDLPESAESKARNKFYMLPLILGLIGLFFHFRKDPAMATVVLIFILYTGLLNILNMNQPPVEPRERDYAVALSFLGFTIWIGIGVLAIFDYLKKKISLQTSAIAAIAVCLIVPTLMGFEGWDDHDRSDRYLAKDSAINYLESVAPNAILFTQGDNDTYPLWYAQEVEGIRPDVRVVNLSLLAVDWYIDQLHNKINESAPVDLRFTMNDYRGDKLLRVPVEENPNFISQYGTNIDRVMAFVKSDNPNTQIRSPYGDGEFTNYIPTRTITIPVDAQKVLANGTVYEGYADKIVPELTINLPENRGGIIRDELMILDIIARNNWERPIYFAVTVDTRKYMGLGNYMQREGLAYRLTPVNMSQNGEFTNTEIMYDRIMNSWKWGGLDKNEIYLDETGKRTAKMLRGNLIYLSQMLMNEQKNEKAEKVLDLVLEKFPERNLSFTDPDELYPIINTYYTIGKPAKANALAKDRFIDLVVNDTEYYYELGNLANERLRTGGDRNFLLQYYNNPGQASFYAQKVLRNMSYINSMIDQARKSGANDVAKAIRDRVKQLEDQLNVNLVDPQYSNL